MADLTQEIELTTSWKDIGAAGSLTSGKSYTGDLRNIPLGATAYQALTDDAVAPTVTGHPWRATRRGAPVPTRQISITSGITVWMRLDRGTATLVLSEA